MSCFTHSGRGIVGNRGKLRMGVILEQNHPETPPVRGPVQASSTCSGPAKRIGWRKGLIIFLRARLGVRCFPHCLGCCARVAAGRRTVAVAAGSEASQGRVPGPLVGGDLAGLPLKLRLALAALDPAWRPLSYTVSYISIIKLDPRFRASDRPLHRTECLYLNLK